jgi:DNA-binding SARP family transcriptional activator
MLEIRILGPVEVLRDGRPVALGGAKQRALVADLTIHANEVVSADRLIDDLWGDEPPDTAPHMLHVYVSRLRKTLEDHGRAVLETRPPGYVLNLEPQDDLDAARFESHIRQARSALDSRPAQALAAFDEALGWWRGRALEEFAHEAFAQPAAARLEELRQATNEGRVEALLALGRHEEALGELEALIARFPLRERPRELQMLALYRSGRQGEALQAFQSARRQLAEELGVDPGPSLVSLEQAILRQDPELEAPPTESRPAAGGPDQPTAPPRPAQRRTLTIALAAVSLVVVALVALRLAESPEDVTGTTGPTGPAGTGAPPSSPPAVSWTEVGPAVEAFEGEGDQRILGGIATPDALIAVGKTATFRPSAREPRDYDAAVWIQSPAAEWRLVEDGDFAATGRQEATDALVVDGRLVVFGSDASAGDFDAAIWTSDDAGLTWARVDPEARGIREPGDQGVRGVTSTGSKVVAVGFTRRGGDEDAAIWTSSDAEDWALAVPTNLDEAGDQQMITVTNFRGLIVAGGVSDSGESKDAVIWTSPDGQDWDRLSDGSLSGEGDQQINAITVGGPGLVAVGEETIDGDENAAVWTSIDGTNWDRVEDPSGALGGSGSQQMSAVADSDVGLVAAGNEVLNGTNGALWVSADGTTWSRVPPAEITTLADFGRQVVRALVTTQDGFVAFGWEGRGGDDDADAWIGRVAT